MLVLKIILGVAAYIVVCGIVARFSATTTIIERKRTKMK